MNVGLIALGFVPWLVFSVMTHRTGDHVVATAAAVSTALAVVLAVSGRERGGIKLLDLAAVVTFGAVTITAVAAGPAVAEWLSNFARGGSTLVLAAVMMVSALTVPFSEQYARDTVDPEFWNRPEFRAVNRRISAVWGAAVLVMALGHLAAGVLDPTVDPASGARPVDLVLNWVVPIILIAGAVRFTDKTAPHAASSAATTGGVR